MITLPRLAGIGAAMLLPLMPVAAETRSVTIVNVTGDVIRGIYLSPTENPHWGSDRMGDDNLQDRQRRTIALPGPGCRYDVRIILGMRPAEELLMDLDLCRTPELPIDGRAGRIMQRDD